MIQRKYLILISIGTLIIALDQVTKMYIHTHYQLNESLQIIANYFDFTYVRNTGAAFGMFRDSAQLFRTIFFMSMPPIACMVIFLIVRGLTEKDTLQVVALSGVFGGALGNYVDRVRYGYVIDFIDVHYFRHYTWPAFNIADSAIVMGVCCLMFIMIQQLKEERRLQKQEILDNDMDKGKGKKKQKQASKNSSTAKLSPKTDKG